VIRCGCKNRQQKRHVLKIDQTPCSYYANHSRLNTQHDWGDLYDHLMSSRILTLSLQTKIFIWAPKIMRQTAPGTIWIC
jgi:hypothetical protein